MIASVCLLAVGSGMQMGYSLVSHASLNVSESKSKEANVYARLGECCEFRMIISTIWISWPIKHGMHILSEVNICRWCSCMKYRILYGKMVGDLNRRIFHVFSWIGSLHRTNLKWATSVLDPFFLVFILILTVTNLISILSTFSTAESAHKWAIPLGASLAVAIVDGIGRRTTLIFSLLPSLVGWTLLASTTSSLTLILGQLLNGISLGMKCGPIFVSILLRIFTICVFLYNKSM